MITHDEARALLHKYGLRGKRIEHSVGVGRFAHGLAGRIAERHPELGTNPERVDLGGVLHDIGRSRDGDHELNSVEILRAEGLPEIAAIVMHGTLYEMALLRGVDEPSYLPRSLENKIVAYADARFRLHEVSLRERIDDISERYADNPEKVRAVDMARSRFVDMERELDALTR